MSPPKESMNAKARARCLDVLSSGDPYAVRRLWDLIANNDAADVLKVHREISTIHSWVEDFMRAMVGLAEENT